MATPISTRLAVPNDRAVLLDWYGDPVAGSLFKEVPLLSEAQFKEWFLAALQDRAQLLVIGVFDNIRVGAVHFMKSQPSEFEASIYLRPPYGMRGLIPSVLSSAVAVLRSKYGAETGAFFRVPLGNAGVEGFLSAPCFRVINSDATACRVEILSDT